MAKGWTSGPPAIDDECLELYGCDDLAEREEQCEEEQIDEVDAEPLTPPPLLFAWMYLGELVSFPIRVMLASPSYGGGFS